MVRRTSFSLVFIVAGGFLFSELANAASFDCNKASRPVERMICSDPELSKLDEAMVVAFRNAIGAAADSSTVRAEQRGWIVDSRNKCDTAACLKQAYQSRIALLKGEIPQDKRLTFEGTVLTPDESHGLISGEGDSVSLTFDRTSAIGGRVLETCKTDDRCKIDAIVGMDHAIKDVLSVQKLPPLMFIAQTQDYWLRTPKEQKDQILLNVCVNETDNCGHISLRRDSRFFADYQQAKDQFKEGLVFKATTNDQGEVVDLKLPFKQAEQPASPVAQPSTSPAPVGTKASDFSSEYHQCMEKTRGATSAILDCMALETARQEVRLGEAYKKLAAQLNPERQRQLRDAQLAFKRFRETNRNFLNSFADAEITRLEREGRDLQNVANRALELERIGGF